MADWELTVLMAGSVTRSGCDGVKFYDFIVEGDIYTCEIVSAEGSGNVWMLVHKPDGTTQEVLVGTIQAPEDSCGGIIDDLQCVVSFGEHDTNGQIKIFWAPDTVAAFLAGSWATTTVLGLGERNFMIGKVHNERIYYGAKTEASDVGAIGYYSYTGDPTVAGNWTNNVIEEDGAGGDNCDWVMGFDVRNDLGSGEDTIVWGNRDNPGGGFFLRQWDGVSAWTKHTIMSCSPDGGLGMGFAFWMDKYGQQWFGGCDQRATRRWHWCQVPADIFAGPASGGQWMAQNDSSKYHAIPETFCGDLKGGCMVKQRPDDSFVFVITCSAASGSKAGVFEIRDDGAGYDHYAIDTTYQKYDFPVLRPDGVRTTEEEGEGSGPGVGLVNFYASEYFMATKWFLAGLAFLNNPARTSALNPKVLLVLDGSSVDTEDDGIDTLADFADLLEHPVADGYTRKDLDNDAVTRVDGSNLVKFDGDNPVWTALGDGIREVLGMLVVHDTGGGAGTEIPICFNKFTSLKIPDGSDFEGRFHADGIGTITQA